MTIFVVSSFDIEISKVRISHADWKSLCIVWLKIGLVLKGGHATFHYLLFVHYGR